MYFSKTMRMKWINSIVLLLCLIPMQLASQPAYKASIPRVTADAFYCIELSAEVMSQACPDFRDLRIMDNEGKQVAWAFRDDTLILPGDSIPAKISEYKAEGKITGLQLVLPFRCHTKEVIFYVSAPRYYRRLIEMEYPRGCFSYGVVDSKNGNRHTLLLTTYTDTLKYAITNGDDQPLTVDSVWVGIKQYSLVTELKAGVDYTLTYGDRQAVYPQYDLSFERFVPDSIGRLTLNRIEEVGVPRSVEQVSEEPSPRCPTFFKTYGIWIIIVLVILQILWMVRKMLKRL